MHFPSKPQFTHCKGEIIIILTLKIVDKVKFIILLTENTKMVSYYDQGSVYEVFLHIQGCCHAIAWFGYAVRRMEALSPNSPLQIHHIYLSSGAKP